MPSEIAIKEGSAKVLRQRLQQIDALNAQVRGFVDALAVENEVPAGWQFDIERMAFVAPPAPAPPPAQSAPEGGDDEPD